MSLRKRDRHSFSAQLLYAPINPIILKLHYRPLFSMDMIERFRGSLLGGLVGDALGAPLEGYARARVLSDFPHGIPVLMFDQRTLPDFAMAKELGADLGPDRTGHGTDDSAGIISLTRSLIRAQGVDARVCALEFTSAWIRQPDRFPKHTGDACRAAVAVIDSSSGDSFDQSESTAGNYGNGGAMRIAPLALAFHTLVRSVH